MKTITLPTHSPRRPLLEHALPLVPLLLVCFALLPNAQAVNPPPDGGYPGQNTAEGTDALFSLTNGIWNTGLGFQALYHNTTGGGNTATGRQALFNNTDGDRNTATGVNALFSNTGGIYNTATGVNALRENNGDFNTAAGVNALYSNTTGGGNTANGFSALLRNTTGDGNTANGLRALESNTSGTGNTANGIKALLRNTGSGNTATGALALYDNTDGSSNTANGVNALFSNTGGHGNTALGARAGGSITTANNVIIIGASVPGQNVSNTCYIGNIFGVTSAGATAVYVNSLGKLGTVVSSRRFKDEIQPMDKTSEAILALKPVTFRYKEEIDPARSPQFGLVAEDVEKVNPDLVVRDAEGKVNTVRYEAVNAMLLNEFLKEHRKNEEQEATIARQQKQIEALTEGLQKVSEQLDVSRPAPQIALNIQ